MFKNLKKQIEVESGSNRPLTTPNPRRLTADFGQFASSQRVQTVPGSFAQHSLTNNHLTNNGDISSKDTLTITNLESKIIVLETDLQKEKNRANELEQTVREKENLTKSESLLDTDSTYPNNASAIEIQEMKNRYDSLLKAYEDYRIKTNDLLAKKDAHIHRLQERVTNLESKNDTDLLHIMTTERNSLRERLETLELHHSDGNDSYEKTIIALREQNQSYESELQNLRSTHIPDNALQLERLKTIINDKTKANEEQSLLLNIQDQKLTELCHQLELIENERSLLAAQVEDLETKPVADPDQIKEFVHEAAQDYIETMDIQSEQHITTLANQVDDLQTTLEERHRDLNALNRELNEKEAEVDRLTEKIKSAECTTSRQQDVVESLREEVDHQKDRTREAARERDDLLLRNASLSHEMEIVRKEAERERQGIDVQLTKLSEKLEHYKCKFDQSDEGDGRLQLEENLQDKEAQIKQLQSRLNEMKKILGKELRKNAMFAGEDSDAASEEGLGSLGRRRPMSMVSSNPVLSEQEEVNIQYLKHVLLRFVTGTDVESGQLVRAVATLLHLSSNEEQFIWDTLAWKSSWVPGPRPTLTQYQIEHS